MTPQQRASVIAEAGTWLGTPWAHMQDLKGHGVDCVMLLVRVFSACGVLPLTFDPRPYAVDWNMHRSEELYLQGLQTHCVQTQEAPQPGDIAMFQFGRCTAHGAIVVDWPMVIHAFRDQRAVVYSNVVSSDYLAQRLRGIYALKD